MSFSVPFSRISQLQSFLARRLPGLALVAALPAWAAGGGGERIVLVIDSRRFLGWKAWWANLYNESHLGFALLTIAIIPALGVVMGLVTDFALSRIGINLRSRVLAEH